jgi:hypothetical protein
MEMLTKGRPGVPLVLLSARKCGSWKDKLRRDLYHCWVLR